MDRRAIRLGIDKMMDMVANLERDNERISWRLLRAMRYRFGRNSVHKEARGCRLQRHVWSAHRNVDQIGAYYPRSQRKRHIRLLHLVGQPRPRVERVLS